MTSTWCIWSKLVLCALGAGAAACSSSDPGTEGGGGGGGGAGPVEGIALTNKSADCNAATSTLGPASPVYLAYYEGGWNWGAYWRTGATACAGLEVTLGAPYGSAASADAADVYMQYLEGEWSDAANKCDVATGSVVFNGLHGLVQIEPSGDGWSLEVKGAEMGPASGASTGTFTLDAYAIVPACATDGTDANGDPYYKCTAP